ncbi:MAG: SAM-dependent methyltransferase [Synergistaceae bacterium]|nr:SAM-dependent methyltransferase [Synergistota bacterium]NLM72028.1 SAM-dependent methyltransferase [Synergistaceae bacterium]
MKTDFLDAHERHWKDSELLFNNKRWANADHLYGMAAECGLKSLMVVFGMPFDTGKDRPTCNVDCKHIDRIQIRYETYRSGSPAGSGYALPDPTVFNNWDVSQRYAHSSHFNENLAIEHRNGTEAIRKLVQQARREGLLK